MTPQEKAYLQGFAKTAEAHGVDPETLIKFAKATPLTDALGTLAGSILPFGGAANAIGATAGILTDDAKEHDGSALKAFIPGVGGYRMGKRLSSQVKHEQEDARRLGRKDVSPVAHAMAERIGPTTSLLLSTLLGGGIGAAVNKKNRNKGFLAGAGIGAGASSLASLGGLIAAGVRRRRTKEEQLDADSESVLKKYLIPGYSSYGSAKRLGRSQGDRDENPENQKKDKKKEKKASALVKSAKKGKTWLDDLAGAYSSLSPLKRRALMAGLASGAGTFLASDGDFGTKAVKGLVGGTLGGAALYGLDNAGMTDKGIDAIRNFLVRLKTKPSPADQINNFVSKV